MIHPRELFPPADGANRFRSNRMVRVRALVQGILARQPACRIIDVGGLPSYWETFGPDIVNDKRVSIALVNLTYEEPASKSNGVERRGFSFHVGDARDLHAFTDKSFDLAHSNSVIEHVGRWIDMVAMASEVRRVARLHFVQTPYWGFPVEPHNRTPLFHWMPEQVRYRLVLKRQLGFWARAASVDEAMRRVQSNMLLDRRQFGALFPTSSIYTELAWGLTKSMVAIGEEGAPVNPLSNTRKLRL